MRLNFQIYLDVQNSQAAETRRASGAEILSHCLYLDLSKVELGVTKLVINDTGVSVGNLNEIEFESPDSSSFKKYIRISFVSSSFSSS